MKYQAIYKCRLCEETYARRKKYSEDEVIRKCGQALFPHIVAKEIDLIHLHDCKDKSCGIADFQGFKAVEE